MEETIEANDVIIALRNRIAELEYELILARILINKHNQKEEKES